MNEADRIASERAARRHQEEKDSRLAEEHDIRERIYDDSERMEELALEAIGLLEATGWSDVTEVSFYTRSLGRRVKRRKGGWAVSHTRERRYGEWEGHPIYLLSDGSLVYSYEHYPRGKFRKVADYVNRAHRERYADAQEQRTKLHLAVEEFESFVAKLRSSHI